MRYLLALLVASALLVGCAAPAAFSVQGETNFDDLAVASLDVAGDAAVAGNLAVAGLSDISVATPLTVTNNLTITVTSNVMPLAAAAAVGTNRIAGCEDTGRVTYLVNVGAQTITITETTGLVMAGNWAAGAGDSLTFVGNGTACYEVARANN